jgi:hypothetical protein
LHGRENNFFALLSFDVVRIKCRKWMMKENPLISYYFVGLGCLMLFFFRTKCSWIHSLTVWKDKLHKLCLNTNLFIYIQQLQTILTKSRWEHTRHKLYCVFLKFRFSCPSGLPFFRRHPHYKTFFFFCIKNERASLHTAIPSWHNAERFFWLNHAICSSFPTNVYTVSSHT